MKKYLSVTLSVLLVFGLVGCKNNTSNSAEIIESTTESTIESTFEETEASVVIDEKSKSFNSTYKIVAEAYDWGAASSKAIVELQKPIEKPDLCSFKISESNTNVIDIERTIKNIYLSDENGNEVTGQSKYITFDMSVDPEHGSLFYYDINVMYNTWDENYKLEFKPIDPQIDILKNLSVNPKYTERITPQADKFTYSEFNYNDINMNYAKYSPKKDSIKNPIVIWLHGQGEGGDDVSITLLGNKVTALADDTIQNKLDKPYVIVPQCPTYWPEATSNGGYMGTKPSKESYYTKALKALIDDVIASNDDIDTNRIYIGGCSMGGYMTMNMIMEYPDFFAAAFPICEFYPDYLISDEQINTLTNMPIWFTYCINDNTVIPLVHAEATINRIKSFNSNNLHVSVFDDVHDTTGNYLGSDGKPYVYYPHWSWVYALNDECYDGDINMWDWISTQ